MDPIKPNSREFNALEAYARNTHGSTHSYFQAKILNAFRVERQSETDAWAKAGYDKLADGDRLLLWHGSRTTNFAGMQLYNFVCDVYGSFGFRYFEPRIAHRSTRRSVFPTFQKSL